MESGEDISVVAKGSPRRCAFCHGGLGEGWEAHCACGSTVHLGCLTEAGDSCPTCGAPTDAPGRRAGVLREQVDALGPPMVESNARLLKALVFAFVLLAAVLSGAFGLLRS